MRGTETRNVRRRRTRPTEAGSQGKRSWGAMRRDVARSLKVGLRDEIDSVKETKIVQLFPILDCETADTRCGAPNPANRQDFPSLGRSFAPTNGPRRPAGRRQEISLQSEQVIPRTDIPAPDVTWSQVRRTHHDETHREAKRTRDSKRTHRAANRAQCFRACTDA